jgi:hypothetical protein
MSPTDGTIMRPTTRMVVAPAGVRSLTVWPTCRPIWRSVLLPSTISPGVRGGRPSRTGGNTAPFSGWKTRTLPTAAPSMVKPFRFVIAE